MLLASCSTRGRFPEKRSFSGQSESWPDRGAPEWSTRLVAKGGAPGGAAPYVTGRAGFTLPREVGTSIPPPRVLRHCTLAPPAAPPPRKVARDWQARTHQRRENAEAWLFEIVDQTFEPQQRATLTTVIARLDRATQYSAHPEGHTNGGD